MSLKLLIIWMGCHNPVLILYKIIIRKWVKVELVVNNLLIALQWTSYITHFNQLSLIVNNLLILIWVMTIFYRNYMSFRYPFLFPLFSFCSSFLFHAGQLMHYTARLAKNNNFPFWTQSCNNMAKNGGI